MVMKICVVGAGVIGLSTAVNIQQLQLPAGSQVTLLAERFSPDTTSDGAAGFWKPHLLRGTPQANVLKWGQATMHYLIDLFNSPEAKPAGVQMLSGYHMFHQHQPDHEFGFIYPRYNDMTSNELCLYGGGSHLSGVFYTSVQCECTIYLPWLLSKFKKAGGHVISRKVAHLSELYDTYDVIVNCTGVGAHSFVSDNTLKPVRGQTIKVIAPWVKHFYVSGKGGDYYILPGRHFVYLGGTHQVGNWNTESTVADRDRIWKGCCEILPSLKNAKILEDWTGLRPSRDSIRLESETVSHGGIPIHIVHNYGHGGSGITLHWGCALEATQLVKKCIEEQLALQSKL